MSGVSKIALLALLIPALVSAGDGELRFLQGLGDIRYHRLDSAVLEQTYHLYVRLPESYGATDERAYPVLYLLDGGLLFPELVGYYRHLNIGAEMPELIVVGISYGTDDYRLGNNRGRDYTAPAADRDYWGGAGVFQEVLAREVLPLIESAYRADATRRILFGHSLGGQFVLHAALNRPELFHGYIASNPALHRNLNLFLKAGAKRGARDTGARLFVASATGDEPRFREPAEAWMRHWTSAVDAPFELCAVDLAAHSHFSSAPAAFRAGMGWLLPADAAAASAGPGCRPAG